MVTGGTHLREQPILLGVPGSAEQFAQVSAVNAMALMSTGAFGVVLVGLIEATHAHPPDYNRGLLVGVVAAAIVMSGALRRGWLSMRLIHVGYYVAVLGVTLAAYAAGPLLAPAVVMLYMWFGSLVTALRRRAAAGVMAWVAACYAGLLVLQPGNTIPVSRWQVIIVAMVCFAVTMNRLVSRSWALAESEHAARAASEDAKTGLEAANEEKTRFLARMSHELRTPLNAIIGFSDVLAGETFGPLSSRQAEYVGDVVDSGRHLLALVDDLLDIAKVETGAIDLSVERIDFGQLLRSSVGLFKEQASRHRIDLRCEVAADLGTVDGDARKVRQVVFNLLSNALTFTPDGGVVQVRARATGDGVRVSVEDSGPGVALRDRDAIFGEFHQAGGADRGTGLGLPLARRFVERHGGRLWVDAADEGGAVFHAQLPRIPRDLANDEAITVTSPVERPTWRVLGEPDSPERRRESAHLITILNLGCLVTVVGAVIALKLRPESANGANTALFSTMGLAAVAVLVLLRVKPEAIGAPNAVPFFAAGCAALFCFAAWTLGPEWGQFLAPFYAWAVAAGVLAVGIRGSIATFLCIAAGHALVLANQTGVVAPVARWVVTMGYVAVTAAIFRRFVLRIQTMTDADRVARADADSIAQQVAVATRHKTNFLTNMSHELRTPLNAIIGFSEVLEQQSFGSLNEKQLEYVRDVLGAGRHLLALINEILDLAKVEAGRMELRPAGVDVDELVRATVASFTPAATERNIDLRVAPTGVGVVTADEAKLRQVVINLLSNAVKFAPDGERVFVRTGAVNGFVEIVVRDTGHGIPPAEQDRIFDAFALGGTSTSHQGPGLGLALARRYAELHGGTLTVTSTPGEGASFTLRLPVGVS